MCISCSVDDQLTGLTQSYNPTDPDALDARNDNLFHKAVQEADPMAVKVYDDARRHLEDAESMSVSKFNRLSAKVADVFVGLVVNMNGNLNDATLEKLSNIEQIRDGLAAKLWFQKRQSSLKMPSSKMPLLPTPTVEGNPKSKSSSMMLSSKMPLLPTPTVPKSKSSLKKVTVEGNPTPLKVTPQDAAAFHELIGMDEVVDVLDRYLLGTSIDPGMVESSDRKCNLGKFVFAASDPAMDMLPASSQVKLNMLFTKTWDRTLPGWSAAKLLLLATIFTQDEIYARRSYSQQHNATFDSSLWSEDPAVVTGSMISVLAHIDAKGAPDNSEMGKALLSLSTGDIITQNGMQTTDNLVAWCDEQEKMLKNEDGDARQRTLRMTGGTSVEWYMVRLREFCSVQLGKWMEACPSTVSAETKLAELTNTFYTANSDGKMLRVLWITRELSHYFTSMAVDLGGTQRISNTPAADGHEALVGKLAASRFESEVAKSIKATIKALPTILTNDGNLNVVAGERSRHVNESRRCERRRKLNFILKSMESKHGTAGGRPKGAFPRRTQGGEISKPTWWQGRKAVVFVRKGNAFKSYTMHFDAKKAPAAKVAMHAIMKKIMAKLANASPGLRLLIGNDAESKKKRKRKSE